MASNEFTMGGMEDEDKRGLPLVELHRRRQEALRVAEARMLAQESRSLQESHIGQGEGEQAGSSKRKKREREDNDDDVDDDDSNSSRSSDSDDSSSENEDSKRKKKDKKHKKDKKKKEHKKKKDKEKERRKKKSKDKKRKKKLAQINKKTGFDDQYGKYGIIKSEDMWAKRQEFSSWLTEIKGINIEHLSQYEEKDWFKTYMEDFNTATLPHKKYYDAEAYHRRKMAKAARQGLVQEEDGPSFNFEEERRKELLVEREMKKQREIEATKAAMLAHKELTAGLRKQEELRNQQAMLVKLGKLDEARKIMDRLQPSDLKKRP